MTDAGRPMSKAALLRIENGDRGLSLDEALAFAAVLFAVPAQMLTPPDDETLWLTEKMGVDGEGLRAWLLHGAGFIASDSEYQRDERDKAIGQYTLAAAQAAIDPNRAGDKAGVRLALQRIIDVGKAYGDKEETAG